MADMEDMYTYIAFRLHAPENARNQYKRIADQILTLEYMPERYKVLDIEPEHSKGIRRMLVDNYSVFFVILGHFVKVVNVLYTPSDFHPHYLG